VESKLRHLVGKLEQIESIKLAHPFNKGFDKEHQCKTEEDSEGVAHGEYQVSGTQNGVITKETDLRKEENGSDDSNTPEAPYKVYTTTFYIGLEIDSGLFSKCVSLHYC
jgi:poly(A) polymerase